MAFKALAQRLFGISRISAAGEARLPRAALILNRNPMKQGKIAPDNGDDGISRRYLHRQSVSTSAGLRLLPTGENLMEKIREMDGYRERIRFDVVPSLPSEKLPEAKVTLKDAVKILKLAQLERARSRLKVIEKESVSYSEYLEICGKDCSSFEQGVELAKMLDQSGSVIVLGNIVLLRPEQLMKAIEELIPIPNDSTNKELQQLEKQKEAIDRKAMSLVRRERWFGLAILVGHTAAFMRLTFWELSWDVMEPICFFVTTFSFIGGYIFYLITAKEPNLEGFFQSRFRTKQKRLMGLQAFDINRYNELKKLVIQRPWRSRNSTSHLSLVPVSEELVSKEGSCVSNKKLR